MTPVAKLQAIVTIPTVSHRDPARTDTEAFGRLRKTMAELWPRVHALGTIAVGEHGLLVRWPGRSSDRPVVLMAHLDVVPVVEQDWDRDPFGAELAERSRLGPRHTRRQGLRRGDLRGGRTDAHRRTGSGTGRVAVVRLR